MLLDRRNNPVIIPGDAANSLLVCLIRHEGPPKDPMPMPSKRERLFGRGHRTEAYTELYDQQDANRIAACQGVLNFATGLPKQRETTFGLGGRQALNQDKTLIYCSWGGGAFRKLRWRTRSRAGFAYLGLQVLLGPK
jgi:hypothetical protein